ncbi:MAG: hypothetical protein KAI70_04020 [Candidatus Omnitrophica bacterium]|nr:hypothetical protein [Candidatus Omnitrophota bacterium]
MPYDSSLDVVSFTKHWENESDRVTVSVRSYNNGQKKLQVSRESINTQGEMKFAKLGRMTKEEVSAIIPMIAEAVATME